MSDQILPLDGIRALDAGALSFAERVGYLKQYGVHSQSFSTLQPGMKYFDVPGIGYVASVSYTHLTLPTILRV